MFPVTRFSEAATFEAHWQAHYFLCELCPFVYVDSNTLLEHLTNSLVRGDGEFLGLLWTHMSNLVVSHELQTDYNQKPLHLSCGDL